MFTNIQKKTTFQSFSSFFYLTTILITLIYLSPPSHSRILTKRQLPPVKTTSVEDEILFKGKDQAFKKIEYLFNKRKTTRSQINNRLEAHKSVPLIDKPDNELVDLRVIEKKIKIKRKAIKMSYMGNRIYSQEHYLKTHLIQASCEDHIKYMNMKYTCLEDSKQEMFDLSTYMFIVEYNFNKFYMRVQDGILRYDLAIYKTLKRNGLVLNLLEHKVIQMRFIGIYRYEENDGLLDNKILSEDVPQYDKYSYMLSTFKLLKNALRDRDPKNSKLSLNLLPSNFLLTKSDPHSVKLICPMAHGFRDIVNSTVPEDLEKKSRKLIDQKTYHIFLLGKLYYFMCFRDIPIKINHQKRMFLKQYSEEDALVYNIQPEIIALIRIMMNESPVDRPSFDKIEKTLISVIFQRQFMHLRFWYWLGSTFDSMNLEVKMEKYQVKHNMFVENESHNEFLKELHQDTMVLVSNKDVPLEFVMSDYESLLGQKIGDDSLLNSPFNMVNDMIFEDTMDTALWMRYQKMDQDNDSSLKNDEKDLLSVLKQLFRSRKIFSKNEKIRVREVDMLRKLYAYVLSNVIQEEVMKDRKEIKNENKHSLFKFELEYFMLLTLFISLSVILFIKFFCRFDIKKAYPRSSFQTVISQH